MDSTLHPLDYPALAREALDGGFTQSLDGFRPTRGYVVSTRKDAERVIPNLSDHSDMMNEAAIGHAFYLFVVDHGHDLRHGYLLGAWRDDAEDRVVIDLVQVFDDAEDALTAAANADQDAIYDVANGQAVQVDRGTQASMFDAAPDLMAALEAHLAGIPHLKRIAVDAARDDFDPAWAEALDSGRWDDDPNPSPRRLQRRSNSQHRRGQVDGEIMALPTVDYSEAADELGLVLPPTFTWADKPSLVYNAQYEPERGRIEVHPTVFTDYAATGFPEAVRIRNPINGLRFTIAHELAHAWQEERDPSMFYLPFGAYVRERDRENAAVRANPRIRTMAQKARAHRKFNKYEAEADAIARRIWRKVKVTP